MHATSHTQNRWQQFKKMKFDKFSEQVFLASSRITISNKNSSSIGTGFIVNIPFQDGTERSALYLVSNKHVFIDPENRIEINFNKRDKNDIPILGDLRKFNSDSFSHLFTEHPDKKIDLACIDISIIKEDRFRTSFRNLNLPMIADFTENDLVPGKEIWFVGYPDNRFDVKNNLPLLRKGHISSLPKIDFNGERKFVIDAQVFQGSSGSPVYTTLGNRFKLIGVITETMIKHGRLQSIPSNHNDFGVEQYLGLGMVIKSTAVKELLDLAFSKTMKELE